MTDEQLLTLKRIKSEAKKFVFLADESVIACEKGEKRNGANTEEQLISDLFDSFQSIYTVIYNQFNNAFQKILYPISYKMCSGENGIECIKPQKRIEKVVKVIANQNSLCIQMPMLPKRVPRFANIVGRAKLHSCVIDTSSIYCNELREALYPYREFLQSREHVVISYSFFYPKNTKYALDSDNHDTKCVTDTIAEFLPDFDSPRTCDFFYRSVFTDKVPSGTYIIVF